jgi:hypothetical protein
MTSALRTGVQPITWCGAWWPRLFGYSINYLIDVKAAVIVDVEPTAPVRTAEVDNARRMIDRTESHFGLKPERLIGDSAYGSAGILGLDGRREGHRTACHLVGKR